MLDELDRHVKEIAHEAVTEVLMTLSVAGETLRLGRDVPGTFPADLETIDNPELRALLGRLDRTPDTTRGSGAKRWSSLADRINYIADLFRVYQDDPKLLGDPFTAEEMRRYSSGEDQRPGGWRTTYPDVERCVLVQREPVSRIALVSKRRPSTTM